MKYSLIYALVCVLVSYIIGMGLALLLNKKIKFRPLFRALLLIPWAIPTVVATANWLWILNDQSGLVNIWLQKMNIVKDPILFFADPFLAKITCIIVGTWKSYPFMTLSLLAGLQGVPDDIYESAKIDGASGIRSFWYITLPMLKNVSMVVITLMFIWGFNNFDIIYLLTQGGPLESTFTLPIYTYNTAFYRGQMGYASAISMMTLITTITIPFTRFVRLPVIPFGAVCMFTGMAHGTTTQHCPADIPPFRKYCGKTDIEPPLSVKCT